MKVTELEIPGVLLVEPRVFGDARGWFMESWHAERYAEAGIGPRFVQDNFSMSGRGTLRGLHYQQPHAQGKLVSVLEGEVWDVAVDIRVGSPTYGRWAATVLSAENHRQLYIPAGFAHGFVVTSERALFHYKCTEQYRPEAEGTVYWNDPELGIEWPVEAPTVSHKDATALPLSQIQPESLPRY
jgi:dTDP-4-dehydrorhamnose 3,5-epimerase